MASGGRKIGFIKNKQHPLGGVFVRQLTERIGADALRFFMLWHSCRQTPLALPLGELSPKVTERALQAFLNGDIN